MTRARLAVLAGVLLVALLVRLPGMDHRLLPDEGYTWLVASARGPGEFLHRLAIYENTPPLYYLLLTPLPLVDEPWIRLPSLICGIAIVAMLYAIVRPSVGKRVALLTALAFAVAPYGVAESNFGRAFLLADVGLLACLWAAVRLAEGGSSRWWWLWAAGMIVALYSEYDAVTTLLPLLAALVVMLPRPRWRTLALGALPAVAFIPWIHQLARSLNDLNVTKTGGGYSTVTPGSIRDQLVALFFGDTGSGLSVAGRTAALLVLLLVLAYGSRALWRDGARARPLFVMLACAGLGTLVLHALAPAFGVGVFDVGYLTFLLPLGCVVLARAVGALPLRAAAPAAAAALVLAGVGLAVKRLHHDSEPDPHAISALLRAHGVRTVLTNSAVVAYYLRDVRTILDRPFDLGIDRQQDCAGCARPIAVVDDAGVGAGARPGPGTPIQFGHYVVRVLP